MVWVGGEGYDRFVAALQDTPLQLQLTKEQWIARKVTKESNVPVLCSKCGITVSSQVNNAKRIKRIGCICTGRFKYNTSNGRTILKQLVDNTRFSLVSSLKDIDLSRGCYSRIKLHCRECSTTVTAQVNALLPSSSGIGCFCARPDELQVRHALLNIINLWENGSTVDSQFKFFGELKGRLGKPFSADFAVFDPNMKLMLIVEVDGWYHFNENPKSRPADCNRSKEHDVLKENWCIDRGVFMVRISTAFVKCGIDAWYPAFFTAVNEAANEEANSICRITHDRCYTKGPYFDVRVGTALEVVDSPVVVE
tara:strand:- start:23 stop:949 length:927 start_codon:yes stop_codon:yes gene_type:complete